MLFFSTPYGLLPVHYNNPDSLYFYSTWTLTRSKFNQAYLLHPASGLTLMYAEISKTMNETMIWPGESGNKISNRTSFVPLWSSSPWIHVTINYLYTQPDNNLNWDNHI